jgi:regulator of RNase E activity RraA
MNIKEELNYFEKISKSAYSGIISDILDEMGFRNQVIPPSLGIKPLKSTWVAIGRAKTYLNAPDTNVEDPYQLAIVGMDQLKPGQIFVGGGEIGCEGIMGELSAHRMRQKDCRGVIANGYTRDSRALLAINFPVFCKGASPIDTTGRVRVVDLDVPIPFGNKFISPGEIVFADLDGIVVFPKECEEEAILKVIKRVDEEKKVRRELRRGKTMKEVWDKYHIM